MLQQVVTVDFEALLREHDALLPERPPVGRPERVFPIRLPPLPEGREFAGAELILPSLFPTGRAFIRLSGDAVLKVPHVEIDGTLCFEGDVGFGSGATAADRLDHLLEGFFQVFLDPWLRGERDRDFELEARNYWDIWVAQRVSRRDAIVHVYTMGPTERDPKLYTGLLLLPGHILLAGPECNIRNQVAKALGFRARQVQNVRIVEIAVDYDLTPMTWPRSECDLNRLLEYRLSPTMLTKFQNRHVKPRMHRVVLLRGPNCSYGYLLPGGPSIDTKNGIRQKPAWTHSVVPLTVDRLDPMWTCGRDQHTEVVERQRKHVLILGAGALGSAVIDQVARAGVGRLSIVDPDVFTAPNIGRHSLGAESLGLNKATQMERRIAESTPSCEVCGFNEDAQKWIDTHGLESVDVVLDLTGEPDVRATLELTRAACPRPLLVGWMEPFVAAAHACVLPANVAWARQAIDPLETANAFSWPSHVIQREPGCSSRFQSYTSAAAVHAVALITEVAMALVDEAINEPVICSWVRGRNFIDLHCPGLAHREWAARAEEFDGVTLERTWNG